MVYTFCPRLCLQQVGLLPKKFLTFVSTDYPEIGCYMAEQEKLGQELCTCIVFVR